jgi:hypothetical protein
MGIQEALVWSKAPLSRPAGVLFDPPCTTSALDLKNWDDMIPAMERELASGRFIMVLVQTRNTRLWNARKHEYDFKPEEDYIVASYSVSADIGRPYKPGTVAQTWLNRVLTLESGRTRRLNADIIHMFQCSDKGCNLTVLGQARLINFHMKGGKSISEATSVAQDAICNGLKLGWRGGMFPGIGLASAAPPLRSRSNAVTGLPPR